MRANSIVCTVPNIVKAEIFPAIKRASNRRLGRMKALFASIAQNQRKASSHAIRISKNASSIDNIILRVIEYFLVRVFLLIPIHHIIR